MSQSFSRMFPDALSSYKLSDLAATTSAELASIISDESGSGLLIFGTAPTFATKITIGTASSTTGSIDLIGTTSGTVTIKASDVAGTWTMKLPATTGSSGQSLQTDGSGNTSWGTVTGGDIYRAYAGGNIDVLTDIAPSKVVTSSLTMSAVKIYLKDGANTGATATFCVRRNGKSIFNSNPTIAAPTQKDAMDATTGWGSVGAGTDITISNDTSIKVEGTGSLKLVVPASGDTAVDKTYGSFNASSAKAITFWIGADAATTAKFYITDGTNTSYYDLSNVPVVSATSLKFLRVYLTSEKLASPDSNSGSNANTAAITHMGFSSLVASRTYYVDDIKLENYYTGTPDTTALIAGDSLGIDCTVAGSTLPGSGLEVVII